MVPFKHFENNFEDLYVDNSDATIVHLYQHQYSANPWTVWAFQVPFPTNGELDVAGSTMMACTYDAVNPERAVVFGVTSDGAGALTIDSFGWLDFYNGQLDVTNMEYFSYNVHDYSKAYKVEYSGKLGFTIVGPGGIPTPPEFIEAHGDPNSNDFEEQGECWVHDWIETEGERIIPYDVELWDDG